MYDNFYNRKDMKEDFDYNDDNADYDNDNFNGGCLFIVFVFVGILVSLIISALIRIYAYY